MNTLFGKDFSKKVLFLEVSKLDSDKTDYEKKETYQNVNKKTLLIRTNKSLVWKNSEPNNFLWLTDFRT